jgi:8-oxo-dGTP pyrophosphatase MutT (NUDIX family)
MEKIRQRREEKHQEVKQQIVSGFIVFRRTEDGLKYLLLYRRGGYWNFPKGHFEQGEDAIKTALRETEEETGLKPTDLHIIPNFKTFVKFYFFHENKKIHDTVILRLAETKKPQIIISPREHNGYAWFAYRDAMKILGRYIGIKRALKQANDFLQEKSPRGGQ